MTIETKRPVFKENLNNWVITTRTNTHNPKILLWNYEYIKRVFFKIPFIIKTPFPIVYKFIHTSWPLAMLVAIHKCNQHNLQGLLMYCSLIVHCHHNSIDHLQTNWNLQGAFHFFQEQYLQHLRNFPLIWIERHFNRQT